MSDTVVCLTGGMGSGKSVVAAAFARRGIVEVDTDRLAYQLTATDGLAIPALIQAFGEQILDASGALDRRQMRQRVFADPAARRTLESILHPMIRHAADRACALAASPYVLLAVPLLVESMQAGGYRQRCRRILLVDCTPELQLARVQARSGLSEDEVRAILATQASRADRLAVADDVLLNEGPLEAVDAQVENLHQRYLMLGGGAKAPP